MTLFIDASALVAIIIGEPERDALIDRLRDADAALWSPMSCWEAFSALCSSYGMAPDDAQIEIDQAAFEIDLTLVPIGGPELAAALQAYRTYGKRSGHRARLNMGDCFAYACAKTDGAKLLYKGEDFVHTDMA